MFRSTPLFVARASIFYFNCEHFLFVFIVKQKQKSLCGFSKVNENQILIIHKPSQGSYARSHTKFGPHQFDRFYVYCALVKGGSGLPKKISRLKNRDYHKPDLISQFILCSNDAITGFSAAEIKLFCCFFISLKLTFQCILVEFIKESHRKKSFWKKTWKK